MHQRDRVRQVFEGTGMLRTKDGKLQRLIKEVESNPSMCWPELADTMRARYPEYKVQLAELLWNDGDKLIRCNLVRHSNPALKDEFATLARFVQATDPVADVQELQAILGLGDRRLIEAIAKKSGIPAALRQVARMRLGLDKPKPGARKKKPLRKKKVGRKNRAGR